MKWEDVEKQFAFDIPLDEPLFPLNVVCHLVHLNYWTLHEIVREGILEEGQKEKKKKKGKKLFSYREVKRLKYVQYLLEEKGVNLKGIKVIIELEHIE